MNILFLVTSFLLIFIFLNSTILKNSIHFSSEKKNFCSYLTTRQNVESTLERQKYNAHEGKLEGTPNEVKKTRNAKTIKPQTEENIVTEKSHRFKDNPHTFAKWNLAPLILAEKSSSYLQRSAESLLENLYSHTLFWQEAKKTIPNLAEALISSFKVKKDHLNTISDLFPEESELQIPFYKMLKGSGSYDLTTKKGFPPLEDFFSLDKEKKQTIELPFAVYPVLEALLGKELSLAIISLEQEKSATRKTGYHTISKEEFNKLIDTLGPDIAIQELNDMINITNKRAPEENVISTDKKKGIALKIPLSKN